MGRKRSACDKLPVGTCGYKRVTYCPKTADVPPQLSNLVQKTDESLHIKLDQILNLMNNNPYGKQLERIQATLDAAAKVLVPIKPQPKQKTVKQEKIISTSSSPNSDKESKGKKEIKNYSEWADKMGNALLKKYSKHPNRDMAKFARINKEMLEPARLPPAPPQPTFVQPPAVRRIQPIPI
jgi:hypothetical protein